MYIYGSGKWLIFALKHFLFYWVMGLYLELRVIIVFGLLFAIIRLWLIKAKGNKNKGKRAPEPSRAWPLIGHLHLLWAGKPQHQSFGAMADKYGPIFCFHIGLRKTSVVSSWEVAKECFTTMDKAFATQPRSLAGKLMGYDHAMFGFSPCRAYCRDVRKLASIVLDCEVWTSFIALHSGMSGVELPDQLTRVKWLQNLLTEVRFKHVMNVLYSDSQSVRIHESLPLKMS